MSYAGKRTVLRWILAGPVSIGVTLAVLVGMPVWFPAGAANVNHIMIPMVLVPAVWGTAFFYAVLSEKLWRVSLVFFVLIVSHVYFAYLSGGWS